MASMDAHFIDWMPFAELEPMLAMLDSDLLVAGLFFAATAILIALCVPGVLIPIALSSGAVLGGWDAAAPVLLGAVAGSQLLFLTVRHVVGDRARERLGERLQRFEERFAAHGIWYVIALRVIGAPHFLVTAGSAMTRIRASGFAIATLVGLLPAIGLAAATGSAI